MSLRRPLLALVAALAVALPGAPVRAQTVSADQPLRVDNIRVEGLQRVSEGTVYNYPVRRQHNQIEHLSMMPAPPEIAVQMWNRAVIPGMVARILTGKTIEQTIAWAKDELEGFM